MRAQKLLAGRTRASGLDPTGMCAVMVFSPASILLQRISANLSIYSGFFAAILHCSYEKAPYRCQAAVGASSRRGAVALRNQVDLGGAAVGRLGTGQLHPREHAARRACDPALGAPHQL